MENTQIAQLVAAYDRNVEVHIEDLAELFGMTTGDSEASTVRRRK